MSGDLQAASGRDKLGRMLQRAARIGATKAAYIVSPSELSVRPLSDTD
jgi:hypothetical protein